MSPILPRTLRRAALLAGTALPPLFALAQSGPEIVEVTSTRLPEPVATDPANITVISADELAVRGARDLQGALALAAGVDFAPGGDNGPAGGVPEFWGLREMDAYLLVIDGVPWGGAYNPALATLKLQDVERIEVLRGAAPVSYGATSFIGVIQVVRRAPGSTVNSASLSAGSYGSGEAGVTAKLPKLGALDTALAVNAQKLGFSDSRTRVTRGDLNWRAAGDFASGKLTLSLDGHWVSQHPASPTPRTRYALDPTVPLDANHNPSDAKLSESRAGLALGWSQPAFGGEWTSRLAWIHSVQSVNRGFLTDTDPTVTPNAVTFRQGIRVTDAYLDTHWNRTLGGVKILAGLEHLHGRGTMNGGDGEYTVALDGSNAPAASAIPLNADVRIGNTRNFSGLYGVAEWRPTQALLIEGGLRLNRTKEERTRFDLDLTVPRATPVITADNRSTTRASGALGASFALWESGANSSRLWGGYRNTFKPAAVDFGIDSATKILEPETATSWELGVKNRFLGGKLAIDVSAFRLDFKNLVTSVPVAGTPVLVNGGETKFRGVDLDARWEVMDNLTWRLAWGLHDGKFGNYVQDFGGVARQLEGNRFEMSPRSLGATGITWAPKSGFIANLEARYTGDRYLNKRNTALADSFMTWNAGLGWRAAAWEFRVDGRNLSDKRDPVSESELGDAQYYRVPARRWDATAIFRF